MDVCSWCVCCQKLPPHAHLIGHLSSCAKGQNFIPTGLNSCPLGRTFHSVRFNFQFSFSPSRLSFWTSRINSTTAGHPSRPRVFQYVWGVGEGTRGRKTAISTGLHYTISAFAYTEFRSWWKNNIRSRRGWRYAYSGQRRFCFRKCLVFKPGIGDYWNWRNWKILIVFAARILSHSITQTQLHSKLTRSWAPYYEPPNKNEQQQHRKSRCCSTHETTSVRSNLDSTTQCRIIPNYRWIEMYQAISQRVGRSSGMEIRRRDFVQIMRDLYRAFPFVALTMDTKVGSKAFMCSGWEVLCRSLFAKKKRLHSSFFCWCNGVLAFSNIVTVRSQA